MATIEEVLKSKNTSEYIKLKNLCKKVSQKKSHQVELGDGVGNLMKPNSYRRIGRK